MANNTSEYLLLQKVTINDLDDMKPLIRGAFESSVIDGIGHIDESMLPDDELNDIIRKDATVYKAVVDNQLVGGAILKIDENTHHNILQLLFLSPSYHSKGIGLKIWKTIEAMYPDTEIWETETPDFSKRNINFYVNKCGFHIVEYFNQYHHYPNSSNNDMEFDNYGLFLFKKYMKGYIV